MCPACRQPLAACLCAARAAKAPPGDGIVRVSRETQGRGGKAVTVVRGVPLDEHGEIAGTASALLGTLQMVTGAVVMACIAPFVDGSAMPMVAGIAACMLTAFVLAQLTLRRAPQPPARLTT